MSASVQISLNGTRAVSRVLSRLRGLGKLRVGPLVFLISLIGPVLGIAVYLGAVTLNTRMVTGQCPMRVVSHRPHALGIASFLGWEVLFGAGMFAVRKRRREISGRELHLAGEIIQNISDGVVVADAQGQLLLSNEAARRISGRGPKDGPSSRWSKQYGLFLPGTDTPFPPNQLPLARAIQGEETEGVDIFVRNQIVPEGAWVSVDGRPLLGEDGDVQGGVVVFKDVTRRKKAEQLSEHLTNAVEQTADAVFITDRRGIIEYVNPAFETITGFPADEALGSNPRILKSGEQDQQYYHELWSAITRGETFRNTTVNRRKCGRLFHAEQTITPMTDEGGRITHFVSVLKDMTERRKIQEQETEMKIASGIQRRLYPRCSPQIPDYDISGTAFPADATCGDYFDFLSISDDKLGIVVADVRGHGIGPAMVMTQTRAYLRAYTRANLDPSEIFRRINNVLNADLEAGFFVTMVLVILDLPTGGLVYANAGHPYGYIFGEDGDVRATLQSTGVPLGLFPDGEFVSRNDLQLGSGDLLVMLTDGIIESEGPDETDFGIERILDIVKTNHGESAENIVNTLFGAAREFEEGRPQSDDITLVACKRR